MAKTNLVPIGARTARTELSRDSVSPGFLRYGEDRIWRARQSMPRPDQKDVQEYDDGTAITRCRPAGRIEESTVKKSSSAFTDLTSAGNAHDVRNKQFPTCWICPFSAVTDGEHVRNWKGTVRRQIWSSEDEVADAVSNCVFGTFTVSADDEKLLPYG